jgi:riboflavin biosynthesis pyrimidine reductase
MLLSQSIFRQNKHPSLTARLKKKKHSNRLALDIKKRLNLQQKFLPKIIRKPLILEKLSRNRMKKW